MKTNAWNFREFCEQHSVSCQQLVISGLGSTVVFMISISGLMGIMFQIPWLYNWGVERAAMSVGVMYSFIMLASGFLIQLFHPKLPGRGQKFALTVLYLLPFLLSIGELSDLWRTGAEISIQDYLLPEDPLSGRISFYSALGILMASVGGLLNVMTPRRFWQMMGIGLFLVNLGMFTLVENVGPYSVFRFLIAVPSSVGMLAMGVSMIFFPKRESIIGYTLFSNRSTLIYTLFLLVLWGSLIIWQAGVGTLGTAPLDFHANPAHNMVILDEMLQVIFTTILLSFGLYILGLLDKNSNLMRQYQNVVKRYSMLAATLSHDMKAPIQTEISAVEMLLEGAFGERISEERVRRMLNSLNENNRMELELVLNLVDLMRFDIHEERFQPEPLELDLLLEGVVRELLPMAMRKDQKLTFEKNISSGTMLTADPMGLKRILHNLINNAIRHIQTGGTIEVSVSLDERGDYRFRVRDNGPGIPVEIQSRLFTPLSPDRNTASGTGLGLFIASQIVGQHGGRIWCESELGQGATFYFTIPAQPLSAVA